MNNNTIFIGRRKFLWFPKFDYKYFHKISPSRTHFIRNIIGGFFVKRKGIALQNIANAIEFDFNRKIIKYNIKSVTLKAVLQMYFTHKYKLYYNLYYDFFTKNKYTKVCVWSGYFTHLRAIADAAKQLNMSVAYFENGVLSNTTAIDFNGINYFNSIPRVASFYHQYVIQVVESPVFTQRITKKQPNIHANVTLPDKYFFVPFQVATDSQIILTSLSPWVRNMEQMFTVITSIATQINVNIVFKEHPSCGKNYNHLRKNLPRNITFADGVNTEFLIKNSSGVITVNSSVGIEAMRLNKQLIVLGNAFYAFDGNPSCKIATTTAELTNILSHNNWQVDDIFNAKFINYLQTKYLINGTHKNATKQHIHEVLQRIMAH